MTKINVITPPDILHNQNQSILLIYPSTELRQEFQKYLEVVGKSINVYLYDPTDEDVDVAWLLALVTFGHKLIQTNVVGQMCFN